MIEATNHPPVLTFEDASKVGAYELARRWREHVRGVEPTPDGETEELAVMAALAHWLTRWLPTQVHRAAGAGADRVSIAAAMGVTTDEVAARWHEWAQGQRDLYCRDVAADRQRPIGISASEYAQVAAVLGITDRSASITDQRGIRGE